MTRSTTKVLIAVSSSPSTTETVSRAVRLVPTPRSLLILSVAHVAVPFVAPVANAAVGVAYTTAQLDEDLHTQALDAAEAVVARVAGELAEDETSRLVTTGEPGPEICRVAADEHVDLVVVGAHDAGVVRRVVLGSVRDHVVHHAPCPVLVIRPLHDE